MSCEWSEPENREDGNREDGNRFVQRREGRGVTRRIGAAISRRRVGRRTGLARNQADHRRPRRGRTRGLYIPPRRGSSAPPAFLPTGFANGLECRVSGPAKVG